MTSPHGIDHPFVVAKALGRHYGAATMKDAIEHLMLEHRLIEKVLGALERYAELVCSGEGGEPTDLPKFVHFIREYADGKHHAKEENVLFEAMVAAGFPREAGPIAVMLHEHTAGRALVERLSALTTSGPWVDADKEELRSAANEFVAMLMAHIQKEDGILYPMARERLDATTYNAVCAQCEESDAQRDQGSLEALASELVERYR
jgi:hemerythrin-like domain-containing protein